MTDPPESPSKALENPGLGMPKPRMPRRSVELFLKPPTMKIPTSSTLPQVQPVVRPDLQTVAPMTALATPVTLVPESRSSAPFQSVTSGCCLSRGIDVVQHGYVGADVSKHLVAVGCQRGVSGAAELGEAEGTEWGTKPLEYVRCAVLGNGDVPDLPVARAVAGREVRRGRPRH